MQRNIKIYAQHYITSLPSLRRSPMFNFEQLFLIAIQNATNDQTYLSYEQ